MTQFLVIFGTFDGFSWYDKAKSNPSNAGKMYKRMCRKVVIFE